MKRWASNSLRSMESDPFGAIRQKLQGMTDIINLSSGDPEFSTPSHIVNAAIQAMKNGETHYTMTNGIPELRAEIAKYYKKFDVTVDPRDEVIVTPGSQQALYLALTSILDPTDEILVPNPSYTVYSPIISYLKGQPVLYDLDRENNFHIDLDALEEKVTEKTKAILLCSPNNPTGTVLNNKDLNIISRVAEEHDLLTISDEIYSEFIWEGRHRSVASFPGMNKRSVIIVSFSKTFAMTGWRLGYLIADRELIGLMLNLQGNMVICPVAFVQRAGVSALKGSWEPVRKMAREYLERVSYVTGRLNGLEGVSCVKPEGAFYAWVDVSKLSASSEDFCNGLLSNMGLVAVAGTHFGSAGEGYIRLALVKPLDVLVEAMNRLESYVHSLSNL
jgi:aspartate/methionine/tyrosine aminotransferase